MGSPLRLGVLISGSGRTLQNFMDLSESGRLKARVVKVVSSRAEAYGLERAARHDVPTAVVSRKGCTDTRSFSAAVTAELEASQVDLVAMAGFLSLYLIPTQYMGRVMNVHPALLPAFGGKGFYGARVHRAVLEYGCKVTGCTVHFADNRYDHGPIIVQKPVEVREGDDEDSLAERVFSKELEAYPEAIDLFADGRLEIADKRVKVRPAPGQR